MASGIDMYSQLLISNYQQSELVISDIGNSIIDITI